MNARETKKKETIRRILDAAAQAFAAAGFEGARIDDIAHRAGVNKAMIYYHIGDKKALYTRVLHDVFGDAAARSRIATDTDLWRPGKRCDLSIRRPSLPHTGSYAAQGTDRRRRPVDPAGRAHVRRLR